VAYKIYTELERQLQIRVASVSTQKAIEIAENIFEIQFQLPSTEE